MTRRLYLSPEEFASDQVELRDARAHRLRDVLRMQPGAELQVFNGRGAERTARVASVRPRAGVTLALGAPVVAMPEPPVPLTLVFSSPRSERGDWLVEKATEIGVTQIIHRNTQYSVMRPGEGRMARWERIAIEAAEQCGRAVVPELGGKPPRGALAIVAEPSADRTADEVLRTLAAPLTAIVLHIGPEGGWSAAEMRAFKRARAHQIALGPRLMRVETAAIVAAAQLLALTGAFGSSTPLAPRRGERGRG